jgi:hypothetical protein
MMEYFFLYVLSPKEFQDGKIAIMEATGLAQDALHIYVGVGAFLLARYAFGNWRWSGPVAWLIVAVFAILGEMLDYTGDGNFWALLSVDAHSHDIINTLFWPTILLLFGTVVFSRKPPVLPASTDQSVDQGLE